MLARFGRMPGRLWKIVDSLESLLPSLPFSGAVAWLYECWSLGLITDAEYFDLEFYSGTI